MPEAARSQIGAPTVGLVVRKSRMSFVSGFLQYRIARLRSGLSKRTPGSGAGDAGQRGHASRSRGAPRPRRGIKSQPRPYQTL
eukprot:4817662-Pleurochrysis_carterae.AAC.1